MTDFDDAFEWLAMGSKLTIHDCLQGSDEWLALRCGVLTASEMKLVITPTGKPANNDKSRSHLYELAAQRITGHVEPHFISDDMLRGHDDEERARQLYAKTWPQFGPVTTPGFLTRRFASGLVLGYSPDFFVTDHGQGECKSRRAKYQIETGIIGVPDEYVLQVQTGLLVSGRAWCDFISYCGGLPMIRIRVFPDLEMHTKILEAAEAAETRINDIVIKFKSTADYCGWPETERTSREIEVDDDEF
jgi:hypothetical protein